MARAGDEPFALFAAFEHGQKELLFKNGFPDFRLDSRYRQIINLFPKHLRCENAPQQKCICMGFWANRNKPGRDQVPIKLGRHNDSSSPRGNVLSQQNIVGLHLQSRPGGQIFKKILAVIDDCPFSGHVSDLKISKEFALARLSFSCGQLWHNMKITTG